MKTHSAANWLMKSKRTSRMFFATTALHDEGEGGEQRDPDLRVAERDAEPILTLIREQLGGHVNHLLRSHGNCPASAASSRRGGR
jgi:hypothetical protein